MNKNKQINDEPVRVTLNVRKDVYAMLEKVSKAMNSVSWMDGDNTVENLLEEFAVNCLNGSDFPEYVSESVYTGANTIEEDKERVSEFKKALDREFNK